MPKEDWYETLSVKKKCARNRSGRSGVAPHHVHAYVMVKHYRLLQEASSQAIANTLWALATLVERLSRLGVQLPLLLKVFFFRLNPDKS